MAQTDSNPFKRSSNGERGATADATAATTSPIGFNELRQACEISALREDLTRLVGEVEGLRAHVEEGVGSVRGRVAGLRAEELADPDVMGALLQFAVGTLIGIRDRVRVLDTSPTPLDDAERSGWNATRSIPEPAPEKAPPADRASAAPVVAPRPTTMVSVQPTPQTSAPPRRAVGDRPSPPSPLPPAPPAPIPAVLVSDPWSAPARPSKPPAIAPTPSPPHIPVRREEARAVDHHAVDWLSPARR